MLKLPPIPTTPGVYQFFNQKNELLYIGKAKNLKNRVRSYFTASADLGKTRLSPSKQQMVKSIKNIKYTIVDNETEALLLERNLIRKHQPPFNIDLKDDKYFLYIKINLNEKYPKVQTTRTFQPDNNIRYFGPYTSSLTVHQTIKLVNKIIAGQIGWTNYWHHQKNLSKTNISQAQYKKIIDQIIKLLSGHNVEVIQDLTNKMNKASDEKNYELAAASRDYITAIKNLQITQRIIFHKKSNEDYLSIYTKDVSSFINLFKIRDGKLIEQHNFTIKHKPNLSDTNVLNEFCEQYYPQTADLPKLIVASSKLNIDIKTTIPRKGDKAKLLKIGLVNAKDYTAKQLHSWEKDTEKINKALTQLQKGLQVKTKLNRIETYDISNIQGAFAVGSMIVFANGKPDKSQYRKFKIKTVQGPDDHHMMQEVIARRLAHKDWPKPDLIILDGGKPQLSTVLQLKGVNKAKIVALAKKEELVYTPKGEAIQFKPGTEGYFLLQRMRDEAHRFAISFYRSKHSKTNTTSKLDELPSIGPKTKKTLKDKYGSWNNIKTTPLNKLTKLIGQKKAKIIKNA